VTRRVGVATSGVNIFTGVFDAANAKLSINGVLSPSVFAAARATDNG
jgi:hypothetical protein